MNRPTDIFENPGGRRGIRTPGTRNSYGSLANCWFQPLTHPSRVRYRIAKHCLSNAGAKLAIYFRPAKFIGIFFLKIFLFAVFSLFIWRFLRFSRPKATIHPYHHRTTRRHRRLRQRGRARDCRSAHFVSSRGCKIFSPRKRIFSFPSRHRGRQTRTKERGGYRSNQDHTLSKETASEFHGRDIHQMVDDGIDGEAGRRMDL